MYFPWVFSCLWEKFTLYIKVLSLNLNEKYEFLLNYRVCTLFKQWMIYQNERQNNAKWINFDNKDSQSWSIKNKVNVFYKAFMPNNCV